MAFNRQMLAPARAVQPTRRGRSRRGTFAMAAGLCCLLASRAHAHGTAPPDLAFWGPFGARTVACLRVIGRATQRCFRQALALHRDCAERVLAGQPCDESLRAARVMAATAVAAAAVDRACLGGQLTELRFAGFDDARADVARACASEAEAVASMWYDMHAPSAGAGAAQSTERACRMRTADLGRKLLGLGVRLKCRALDRIAVRILEPSGKRALLRAAETRELRAQHQLADRLGRECPDFEATYGRSPDDFLGTLARRADCVVHANYFQTAVTCPPAVCGNGIKEAGEACDDGNADDADQCRNDCTVS
jgi:cysteine-rich repeat protein